LFRVSHETGEATELPQGRHPVRYPAVSPDGKRLAFSMRQDGSWHLFTRTIASGYEQQLTHAPCNTISPSWEDSKTLLYATDCGMGVGLSAIARVELPN
jgi:Tol biopolymer transport system component